MVVHSIVYFVTMVWGRSPQLGEPQLGEPPQTHYGGTVLRSSGHHNHPCRNSGPTDSVGPHIIIIIIIIIIITTTYYY
jgi:hypothetical protein